MPKVTRIKASDKPREKDEDEAIVRKRVSVKDKASKKEQRKKAKAKEKKVSLDVPTSERKTKLNKKVVQDESSDKAKKPFVLFRPFIALGHYLRDSWHELRQVRWPNRKMTWQMLVAVILYAALFMVLIMVIDLVFSRLSNLLLNR